MKEKTEKKEKKEKVYKLIEEINKNTDYLCAKQFYNYWYDRR